MTSTISITPR